MSLEEDIQQKEFRSDYHKAFLNILHTHYFLVDKMNAMLKKYDITRQQYNVLRILRGQYPGHASVNLIKDRMLDKMSDASRIVERLRLKELITREYCENDKRKVEVKITPKGLLLLEAMQPSVDSFDKLLQNLSPAEARQLSEFLDKIRISAGGTNATSQNSGEVKTEEKITTLASF
ncbi:MAG TPA: MarR family transcriptional regulator [Ohtaekwangia sp.]|nr:MarR family transcriptional regulator [Ohtaekwangia sp.]